MLKPTTTRRRFNKKADSLDISRYGLWGDSPPEVLFYISFLLVVTIGGLLVERKKCLGHIHPPAEYHVHSARDLYPVALAEAQSINPNAYLSSILLTAFPIKSNKTPYATFWFFAEKPSQKIFVHINGSLIFSSSTPSLGHDEKEIPIESILMDSQDALDMIIFYAHSRWGCPKLELPISLVLRSPFSPTRIHPYWASNYSGKSAAYIELDPEVNKFIVIYNEQIHYYQER